MIYEPTWVELHDARKHPDDGDACIRGPARVGRGVRRTTTPRTTTGRHRPACRLGWKRLSKAPESGWTPPWERLDRPVGAGGERGKEFSYSDHLSLQRIRWQLRSAESADEKPVGLTWPKPRRYRRSDPEDRDGGGGGPEVVDVGEDGPLRMRRLEYPE